MVLLDELGFDEVWVGEHHSTGWENIAAPEVFIAAAAERTDRIDLGTGVMQLGLHHPLVALDRMIFLDHLTKGRASFGMGVGGGIPSDLTVFGLDHEVAGRRMQESLDTMLRLLEGSEPVTIETDWFALHDAVLQLRPYTEPHMKFAVASADPRNVEMMGRLGGDVLIGGMPGKVADLMGPLQRGAASSGRTAHRSQIKLSYMMHIAEDRVEAVEGFREGAIKEFYEFQVGVNGRPAPDEGPDEWYREYVDRNVIGSVDDAISKLSSVVDQAGGLGGFIFMTRSWAGVEAREQSWRLFAQHVIPALERR